MKFTITNPEDATTAVIYTRFKSDKVEDGHHHPRTPCGVVFDQAIMPGQSIEIEFSGRYRVAFMEVPVENVNIKKEEPDAPQEALPE